MRWLLEQVNPFAVSTTDSDVTAGRDDRRDDSVATPVDNRTAENQLQSVERKPEATNNSRQDTTPNKRKRKEKTKTAVDLKAATMENKPKEDINGDEPTILNVPQYADTKCTLTAVADVVTDLDKPLSAAETER